ncbi:MAG: hypothetical protein AAF558_05405 [Verrucomicrobiota bacterium]
MKQITTICLVCWVFVFSQEGAGQMVTGRKMENFNQAFSLKEGKRFESLGQLKVTLLEVNAPGCMFLPGEQPEIIIQIENLTEQKLNIQGRADLVQFATRGIPGDIWDSSVVKLKDLDAVPIELTLEPKGFQNVVLKPRMPETKGGYGVVIDLGKLGRDFLCGMARVFEPDQNRVQYPKQSLDKIDPPVLERLGIKTVRYAWPYVNSEHPRFEHTMKRLAREMDYNHKHRVTLIMEFGSGDALYDSPLDPELSYRTHLNEKNELIGGKGDMAWMPKDDPDFEEYVYQIACNYGWPKGPITGFMLWNEPWEGISISGWGADMIRYRTIYQRMGQAVERARKDAGVDVLIGGCDSSANTWDKLFPDNKDTFMKYFDFCSVHYQGMHAPAYHRPWINRTYHKGRVLIWDTESWVANTDDRVAGLVATKRAAGYDRSLGIYYGNICTQLSHNRVVKDKIRTPSGTIDNIRPLYAWPVAASVSAVQYFLGERVFKEILFPNGLPWIYVFEGLDENPDDGTIMIVGDIGALFKQDEMLFRTVRSLDEVQQKERQRRQREKLTATDAKYAQLTTELEKLRPYTNTKLILSDERDLFRLYDFYGNPVSIEKGRVEIPLDSRGFFLRAQPGKKGSFAALVQAIRDASIVGYEPVEIIAHDMLKPVTERPVLKLDLNNILNQEIRASVTVQLAHCKIDVASEVVIPAHSQIELPVRVLEATSTPDNRYDLRVEVKTENHGTALHYETMRVNLIAKRTIKVDGTLDDWSGALPQVIKVSGKAQQSLTEQAWLPFVEFDSSSSEGLASGYLAYDDQYFYFAGKVADGTKHPGTVRFETVDDAMYFYPKTVYSKTQEGNRVKHQWKKGVRQYSYRKTPTLPDGGFSRFDNIQIAFNAIPNGEDDRISYLPGRMPRFTPYKCTDYEYALNKVADAHGGGHEIWRLLVPDMPRKHFYPRQPKSPEDGPVKEGKLITIYRDNMRITEVAIPWSELPDVKERLDTGQTIKFSFHVNHEERGPIMELARGRSVSKLNKQAFHVDWQEHWANELEFAFGK